MPVRAVVVEVPDAGIRDVERAVADARVFERRRHDVDDVGVDLHRTLESVRVHLRELALRLVRAHEVVGAVHVGHDRVDGIHGQDGILAPELHRNARAHDGFFTLVPRGTRGRESGQQVQDQQQ